MMKEAVVIYIKKPPRYFLEGRRKATNRLSPNSGCQGRNSKLAPSG